jgi:hypothetical protein
MACRIQHLISIHAPLAVKHAVILKFRQFKFPVILKSLFFKENYTKKGEKDRPGTKLTEIEDIVEMESMVKLK